MCNGENILCKIAHKIIIDKIKEEIAMEVIAETELHSQSFEEAWGDLKILKLREN